MVRAGRWCVSAGALSVPPKPLHMTELCLTHLSEQAGAEPPNHQRWVADVKRVTRMGRTEQGSPRRSMVSSRDRCLSAGPAHAPPPPKPPLELCLCIIGYQANKYRRARSAVPVRLAASQPSCARDCGALLSSALLRRLLSLIRFSLLSQGGGTSGHG